MPRHLAGGEEEPRRLRDVLGDPTAGINRTLRDDFAGDHEGPPRSGADGLAELNLSPAERTGLADCLLWRNTGRPHENLDGEVAVAVLPNEAVTRADRPRCRPALPVTLAPISLVPDRLDPVAAAPGEDHGPR